MKRKIKRKLRRLWKIYKNRVYVVGGVLGIVALMLPIIHTATMNTPIDPTIYNPLLSLIGRAESNNNDNAYFGHPDNTTIPFTSMSVGEVLTWQKSYIDDGNPSSAVGRYQLLSTTLEGLVTSLGIDQSQKFDRALQDKLAVALLEKRGAGEYVRGSLTQEEFAANLAKEWAALPKVIGNNPEQSYYAGDGLNASRVSILEIMNVTGKLKDTQ